MHRLCSSSLVSLYFLRRNGQDEVCMGVAQYNWIHSAFCKFFLRLRAQLCIFTDNPCSAGLGITLFGMMYMFVHDGLVHKRFPVGPLADVPYLKRVAAAHTLHHAEKFNGVPWGLFLGPQELQAVGGAQELDLVLQRLDKARRT